MYYLKYLYNLKYLIFLGFINGIIASYIFSYIPIYYSKIIQTLLTNNKDIDVLILLYTYIYYKAIGNVFASIRGGLFIHIIAKITKRIKLDILEQLSKIKLEYFENKSRVQIYNILNEDCEKSTQVLTTNINLIVRTITQFIITSYILYNQSKYLYFIVIILSIIDAFFNNLYYNKIYDKYLSKINKIKQKQNELIVDYVNKIEVYRVNALDNYIKTQWNNYQIEYDSKKSLESFHYIINSFLFNMFHSIIVIILLYIAIQYNYDYIIIHRFLLYLEDLIHLLHIFHNIFNDIYKHKDNIKRVNNILEEDTRIIGYYLPNKNNFYPDIKIDIKYFKYPNTHKSILEDCSYQIKFGSILGIKGPSGYGKSTLLKLIMGLYDIEHGAIFYNNINLKYFDKKWLYDTIIAYVNQEPVLFEGTVEDNIKSFDSTKQISNNLLELIKDIDKNNIKVSGGQKQRIAICRAILKNPRILILDEPTSALDKNNEKIFIDLLHSLHNMYKMTIIIVSHNEQLLKNYQTFNINKKEDCLIN